MTVRIPTEQGFVMTYRYNQANLRKLRELVTNGGQNVVGIDYLQSSNGYLRHFKGNKFEGPYYAMPLNGVLEIINSAWNLQ